MAVGSGAKPELERANRVQGNFSEYVPFALLLFAFVEFGGGAPWAVHGLCLILLGGRLSHAFGVSRMQESYKFRVARVAITISVLAFASALLLMRSIGPLL